MNPAAINYYNNLPHKEETDKSRPKSNKRKILDSEEKRKKSTSKKKTKCLFERNQINENMQ